MLTARPEQPSCPPPLPAGRGLDCAITCTLRAAGIARSVPSSLVATPRRRSPRSGPSRRRAYALSKYAQQRTRRHTASDPSRRAMRRGPFAVRASTGLPFCRTVISRRSASFAAASRTKNISARQFPSGSSARATSEGQIVVPSSRSRISRRIIASMRGTCRGNASQRPVFGAAVSWAASRHSLLAGRRGGGRAVLSRSWSDLAPLCGWRGDFAFSGWWGSHWCRSNFDGRCGRGRNRLDDRGW